MPSRFCIHYVSKSGKPSNGQRTGKHQSSYPIPKKGSTKECANHQTVTLISHASKVMLKILHARLQHYMNQELQMSTLGLGKEEEPEIKLPTFSRSQRKQRNSRKTSTSASLTIVKPLWIITNCGKLLKRWNTRLSYLSPEKPVYRSRSNSQNQTQKN